MKRIIIIINIIIPLIISAYAIFSPWQRKNYQNAITKIKFSKSLVLVSKYLAQERGYIYVYALQKNRSDELKSKISTAQTLRIQYFNKALEIAGNLNKKDLGKLEQIQINIKRLRAFDTFSAKNATIKLDDNTSLSASQWFEKITVQISALRGLYSENLENLGNIMENLDVVDNIKASNKSRDLIWEVFEKAGQERALIGGSIAQKTQIPNDRIDAIRVNINEAWKGVPKTLETLNDSTQSKYISRVASIEDGFFVKYEELRDSIIRSNNKGISYSYSSDKWLIESTVAIDLIISLDDLLSRNYISMLDDLETDKKIKENDILSYGIVIVILFGVFVLWLVYILFFHNDKGLAAKVQRLHQISNKLLRSVSTLAVERGISKTIIASKEALDDFLPKLAMKNREETKKILIPALNDIQNIQSNEYDHFVNRTHDANIEIQNLRNKIDKYFEPGNFEQSIEFSEKVFSGFTKLIDLIEELQLATVHSFALKEHKNGYLYSNSQWYNNLTETAALRHFIWNISEYAGQQRALIGAAISSNNKVHAGKNNKLKNEIKLSWDIIQIELLKLKSKKVSNAYKDVKQIFFGTYQEEIEMHLNNSKEIPDYEDNSINKWFEVSNAAIEHVLLLSEAIGEQSEERIVKIIQSERRVFLVYLVLYSLSIILMYIAINSL